LSGFDLLALEGNGKKTDSIYRAFVASAFLVLFYFILFLALEEGHGGKHGNLELMVIREQDLLWGHIGSLSCLFLCLQCGWQ
jgi:hypothetical protein